MSSIYLGSASAPSSQGSTPSPRKGRWTLMNNPIMNFVDQLISKLGDTSTSTTASKMSDGRVTTAPSLLVQSVPTPSKPISIPTPSRQTTLNMSHRFAEHMKEFDPKADHPSGGSFYEEAFELVEELKSHESKLKLKLIDPNLINELNSEYGKQIEKETALKRAKDLKTEIFAFCKRGVLLSATAEETQREMLEEAIALHEKISIQYQNNDLERSILLLEGYGETANLEKARLLGASILRYCHNYLHLNSAEQKTSGELLLTEAHTLHRKLVRKYKNFSLVQPIELLLQTIEQNK